MCGYHVNQGAGIFFLRANAGHARFGVRRLDAAFREEAPPSAKSGVKPPHSIRAAISTAVDNNIKILSKSAFRKKNPLHPAPI